jgi:hypothetical protein
MKIRGSDRFYDLIMIYNEKRNNRNDRNDFRNECETAT